MPKPFSLIDKINFRGKIIGGAKVSELHTNFLINNGNANSLDLELLGEEIRTKVKKKYNINLDYEVNENSFGQINYTFTDEMFNSDVFLGTREIQDSYSIVNASWTLVRGNKQLQFYVNNLTDETAELGRNYEDYVDLITVNRPRSIGIKFSWLLDK